MATQLQATITSINGATQASPISMSFPIDSVLVYEEGSGSVIQLGNNKFSSSDSLSSLSTTGLVQATVLTVDNGGAVNRQFLFPASKIGITSSSTGAAILYNSSFYHVSETEDALVAAANSSSGGTGTVDSSLSTTSTNAIQNAAVTKKLNDVVIDVAKAYGVVADGVTDNATALMQMRTDLAGTGKPHYILIFPPGEIRYSDNRWLYNIQSFECIGRGTTLRSIRGGSWPSEWYVLQGGDPFTNNVMSSYTPTYAPTYLFNTVAAGSRSIALTTTSDGSNFAAGNRVLLFGFDKTLNGYPPNPAFFEYATVVSVSSGVVTLNHPLENRYNSGWKDTANYYGSSSFGKPRILNLDRSDYRFPKYAKFTGFVFGNGTKGTGSIVAQTGVFQFCGEKVITEQCSFDYAYYPSMSRKIYIDQCTNADVFELDKIIDYCEINDSEFANQVGNGTSIKHLVLRRNRVSGQTFISPYILTAEGNSFKMASGESGALLQAFDNNYIKSIVLKDNTFTTDTPTSNGVLDFGSIKSINVDGVSGNNILVNDSNNDTTNQVPKTLRPGVEMWKSDGSKRGKVVDVTHNGTQWVIAGTWPAPVTSETWKFSTIGEIQDKGGNELLNGDSSVFWSKNAARFQGNVGGVKGLQTTTFDQTSLNLVDNGGQSQFAIEGRIVDITLNVFKPYTGSNDNAHMFVYLNGNSGTRNLDINLMATGIRTVTASATSGAQAGDGTASTSGVGSFANTINIDNLQYTSFQKIAVTNPQDAPQFELTIHWYKN